MTNTARAVFLDHPSLDLGDLDLGPLRNCFSDLQLFARTTPDQVIERLKGATVAITNKIVIDAQAMAASPELKLILISATGTNNVDLAAARSHGITVCNCQGYGTPSVAQHTIMLLLNLATRLADYQKKRWVTVAGNRLRSSACWTIRLSNWKARPWACWAMVNWAVPSGGWPKPLACVCCWGRSPGARPAPTACRWNSCCRKSMR
nr:hypothetical protein GCM10020185_19260 [Pseudomonas brassicacearum subsp. brassicacearum]